MDTTPSLYSVGEHIVLAFNNQENHFHLLVITRNSALFEPGKLCTDTAGTYHS